MGDKEEPRKEFIEQNSKLVVDLDVYRSNKWTASPTTPA